MKEYLEKAKGPHRFEMLSLHVYTHVFKQFSQYESSLKKAYQED
jgi:hypothetical protein